MASNRLPLRFLLENASARAETRVRRFLTTTDRRFVAEDEAMRKLERFRALG
jgi:hypothetical protein